MLISITRQKFGKYLLLQCPVLVPFKLRWMNWLLITEAGIVIISVMGLCAWYEGF